MTASTTLKRFRNPSPSDSTGIRLIEAALRLIENGTPFHELRLADAVGEAGRDGDAPLSRGAAYTRFHEGQTQFKMAVLAELLRRGHSRHRDQGGRRAQTRLARMMRDKSRIDAEELQTFIRESGRAQMRSIVDDRFFTLRIYALGLLAQGGEFPERHDLLTELRTHEVASDKIWTGILQALMGDRHLKGRSEDLDVTDFEIFLSALATGLAVRRLLASSDEQERLDRLFPELIAAAGLGGFFVPDGETPLQVSFAERLSDALS